MEVAVMVSGKMVVTEAAPVSRDVVEITGERYRGVSTVTIDGKRYGFYRIQARPIGFKGNCPRCGGSGQYGSFGTCFRCSGTGRK